MARLQLRQGAFQLVVIGRYAVPFVRSFHEVNAFAHFGFHQHDGRTARSTVGFGFRNGVAKASKSWPSQVNTCQLNAAHLPAKSPRFMTSSVEPSICCPLQSTKLIKLSTPWCGVHRRLPDLPFLQFTVPVQRKDPRGLPVQFLHLRRSNRRAQSLAQDPRQCESRAIPPPLPDGLATAYSACGT